MATKPNVPVAAPIKLWTKRLQTYLAGAPIEKSKIGALCTLARGGRIPFRSTDSTLLGVRDWAQKTFGYGAVSLSITSEQTAQGLKWLGRREIQKLLTTAEAVVLRTFDRFTFQGVHLIVAPRRMTVALPVYRVWSTSGSWFDYVATPWQANAEPFSVIAKSW